MSQHFIVKLKHSGMDIVGILEKETDSSISLSNPIQIDIDPNTGFFAKSFLLLAEKNIMTFSKEDVLLFDVASDKSIKLYGQFQDHFSKMEEMSLGDRDDDIDEFDDISDGELAEMFEAQMQRRTKTIH